MEEENEPLPEPREQAEDQLAAPESAETAAENAAAAESLADFELPPAGQEESAPDVDPAVAAGEAAGYRWRAPRWPGFALAGAVLILGGVLAFAHPGPIRDFMIAS